MNVGNEVTLDFYDEDGEGTPQHYAFLVGEDEFDQIFGRVKTNGLAYWADPGHRLEGGSIPTTAGAGSTSMTRAGTSSRSSRSPTPTPDRS